jgi:hypothetical protein
MRFGFSIGAMLGAVSAAAVGLSAPLQQASRELDRLGESMRPLARPHRGKGKNNRRGRGKVTKPRKRPNRLVISKRVRRRHRRAA